MKKGILVFLAFCCLLSGWQLPLTVTAEPETQTELIENQEEPEPTPTPAPTVDAEGRPILLPGETAIVIDQASGAVLYESGSQERMFPASCTKVMTCLLAVEAVERGEISMDEEITITAEMLEGLPIDGSSMALKEGEVLKFQHLLWGLMIPSGNDAAMAIAFRLAGGETQFADKMNQRVRELGLQNTRFVNPHGLHDEGHYTTAADMARIAYTAMQKEAFRNIVDIAHIKIPPTNLTEKERYYLNTNGLLSGMRYLDFVYKGATGIKTGRTTEAGNCLVSSAKRGNMHLIGVLFGGKEIKDSHNESARILDYGFEYYHPIRGIAQGELLGESKVKYAKRKDTVTLAAERDVMTVVKKEVPKEDLEIRLNLPEKVCAPIKEGEVVGSATVLYQGQELGETPLLALVGVKRSIFWPVMALGDWLWSLLLVRIAVYLFLAAAGIFLILILRMVIQEMKKPRRSRKR